MEIPRHWRLIGERNRMTGNECPHCNNIMFPPKDICTTCNQETRHITNNYYKTEKLPEIVYDSMLEDPELIC